MERMIWCRTLVVLSLALAAAAAPAPAPASALTPSGRAQAEGQRSSNKYALGADPSTADWTQGSQLPQGTGVLSASGDAFQNTASHPNSTQPSSPAGTGQPSGRSEAAAGAANVEDIAPASSNFATTAGVHFTLDGNIRYFPGSNDYFLILRNGQSSVTDDQVRQFFQVMAVNGIQLLRTWAFCNGVEFPCDNGNSLQPTVGAFNEVGFQRLDLIMAEAAKNDIHVIFPFVNHWPDLGGMQWYVDQVLGNGATGSGGIPELFYTDARVIQAYRNYISYILNRRNTITGVLYKDDPIIFALELANEPRTTDNYEIKLGLKPGAMVMAWVYQTAAYIKSISPNHMISTGEEGFRVNGNQNEWYNNGTNGMDFDANIACPDISFATVHLYPENWGIPVAQAVAFSTRFLSDRAAVARGLGKPYILEETGRDALYDISYVDYLLDMFSLAEQTDAAAIMPWELVPFHTTAGNYDFGIDDAAFGAVSQMVQYYRDKTAACAGGTCPGSSLEHTVCTCFDIPPDGNYTCAQQVNFHPNCSDPSVSIFLGPGFCDISCGRCAKCADFDYCELCVDAPPLDSNLTCAQQVAYHPDCSAPDVSSYLGPGTCDASCGRCTPCPVEVVPACQANIEVGPTWASGEGSTEQSAKFAIYLTAPANTTFIAPYTLSITGRAPFTAVSTWNWDANVDSAGKATGLVQNKWEDLLPPSLGFVEVGGTFTGPTGTVFPQNVTINGIFCGLVGSVYYGA